MSTPINPRASSPSGAGRPITLEAHMLSVDVAGADSLAWVMSSIALGAKAIAAKLSRARIEDVIGEVGTQNVQGEEQQKLDVISNDLMMALLSGEDGVAVLGSEEDEALTYTGSSDSQRVAVLFDPLDGSSNLDVGGSVGTIFSIFEVRGDGEYELRPGREQIAAGYVLYGPATTLVLATGHQVSMFVLDPMLGAFVRVEEKLRIPDKGKIYSVNEANLESFPDGYQRYLGDCHERGHSARYAGAMVADVHRVLLKGGVFLYPPTAKAPNGKLRLMYECNPMAKIITTAGGRAVTGTGDVLDVVPSELHQRVPVALGSAENVDELLALL